MSFFTSDVFRLSIMLLGIVLSSLVIIGQLAPPRRGKVFETVAMVTYGVTGFASLVAFVLHYFFSDTVAESIGWAAGSPFQKEVAGANLAIGLLGFLGFWRRDFWLPYVISKSAFLWIAGVTHVADLVQRHNTAPGNAGITLYMDFIWPIVFILLWRLAARNIQSAPDGLAYKSPRL